MDGQTGFQPSDSTGQTGFVDTSQTGFQPSKTQEFSQTGFQPTNGGQTGFQPTPEQQKVTIDSTKFHEIEVAVKEAQAALDKVNSLVQAIAFTPQKSGAF